MPTNNKKTIKYFFTEIYNSGNLLDLVVPFSMIKKIDSIYKSNYNAYNSFSGFEAAFPSEFNECKKSKSAYKELKKQFAGQMALQPGVLTECFVSQTIANHLNLDQFIDLDDEFANAPAQLLGAIYSSQGYSDGSAFRYCYYNSHFDTFVLQCGASGTVDVVFSKYKYSIRVEIKEKTSKLEECDITGLYNERGYLGLSSDFAQNRSKYVPFIHLFNAMTTIFDSEGHNFNISQYLSPQNTEDIVSNVLNVKVVDMFILVIGNKLVPTLPESLFDFVSFDGSEIRTAGRNYKKVFTPIFTTNKISSFGGHIINGVVSMPYDPDKRVKGRHGNTFSRYSIGSLLFVPLEKCAINANTISFQFDDICQKVPSISIHLDASINFGSLANQAMKVNGFI